jgi:hypothetical protein
MRAKGHEEMPWQPPHTDREFEELFHQLADLITARLAHNSEDMREAARRMIPPIVRLAASRNRIRHREMATIAQGLADYLYFAAEDLPRRAMDSISDIHRPVSSLSEFAENQWALLPEEVLREQDKVAGPDAWRQL